MSETQVMSDSVVGYPDSLALFSKPLQNIGIRRVKTVEHLPVNDVSTQNVITFNVSSAGSSYIDLSKTLLWITAKIVNGDGTKMEDFNIAYEESPTPPPQPQTEKAATFSTKSGGSGSSTAATATAATAASDTSTATAGAAKTTEQTPSPPSSPRVIVTPSPNFLHTLFQRVDILLQNNLVTESDCTYSYAAYFKALQASPEEKASTSEMQMYFEPVTSNPFGSNWLFSEEPGTRKIGAIFQGSREVTMCGKIASSIFDVDRLLINGVPLQVALYPNKPDFCLMSPGLNPPPNFKVIITKAILQVSHVEIAPEMMAAHSEMLKSTPALYPVTKTVTKFFAIAQGAYGTEIPNPFEGRQPAELVIGIVDAKAMHGDYAKDSLYFEHCHLRSIQCVVDGVDLVNSPIYARYDHQEAIKSSYLQAYNSLRGLGGASNVVPFGMLDYYNGRVLYRFLSEEHDTISNVFSEVVPLKRSGNVRVTVQFDKPLAAPKTLVMFAKFAGGFKVDKNRAVSPM